MRPRFLRLLNDIAYRFGYVLVDANRADEAREPLNIASEALEFSHPGVARKLEALDESIFWSMIDEFGRNSS